MVDAVTLVGRYRLEARIASGGMGSVYAAADERLGRRVAIKLLHEALASDPQFIERFRREARAVAALSHPNIAGVFDYGEDDGRKFIVMEVIDGTDLEEVMRSGPLEAARAVAIAAQCCDALAHAHAMGIVHRDIKPANIIIDGHDRVKITDFGIARAVGNSTLTTTGSMLGTAHYISPEQASGRPVSAATDQYALGVVLFEMLTGRPPFEGDSPVGIAMLHVSEPLPLPSSVRPGVPRPLDDVVARATAKTPADRYPGVEGMAGALRAAAQGGAGGRATPGVIATGVGEGTGAPPFRGSAAVFGTGTRVPGPADGWGPRRVGRAAGVALGALALVALGLAGLRLATTSPQPLERAQVADRRSGTGPSASTTPSPRATLPATFSLPNVTGERYEDAVAALHDLGLEVSRVDDTGAKGPPDVVISTQPPAGGSVSSGDKVEVVVAVSDPAEEHGKGDAHGNDDGDEGEGD